MELSRKKSNAHIEIIPVGIDEQIAKQVELEVTSPTTAISKPMELGPAGHPGYNVDFSTDRGLGEILDGYQRFIDVGATIIGDDPEMDYSGRLLRDLPSGILSRLDQSPFVRINQEEGSTQPFLMLWYNIDEDRDNRRVFALNVPRYHDEVMDIAYGFTNFHVEESDKQWLRSTLNKNIN